MYCVVSLLWHTTRIYPLLHNAYKPRIGEITATQKRLPAKYKHRDFS
jgi:hypothetical protein